ncbi:hypothetical protein ACGGV8_004210, partial [Salmonella enterica]
NSRLGIGKGAAVSSYAERTAAGNRVFMPALLVMMIAKMVIVVCYYLQRRLPSLTASIIATPVWLYS